VKLSTRTSAVWGLSSLRALVGFDIKATVTARKAAVSNVTDSFFFVIHFLFKMDLLGFSFALSGLGVSHS
jgi:hypothetical protein